MATTFDKIRAYYANFDEWGRLDSASGILEQMEVLRVVLEKVPQGAHLFDLGSGPGRYAIEFAKAGYTITLMDLSERLIIQAREKFEKQGLLAAAHDFRVGNAADLVEIKADTYDAVFSCGPFYHLVDEQDRIAAAQEALRVCKPGGVLLIGFVPRFSGLAGLVFRAANGKGQISPAVFQKAADEGVFHNASDTGFQEGYYPTVQELKTFWSSTGLREVEVISTRSFMHQNEARVLEIREKEPELFETILAAHRTYARSEAFVEAGGHALLIGKK